VGVENKITDGRFHPVAEVLPLLEEPVLAELARDITANGLRVPIVVDADGAIIDGRNRYLACQRTGVQPRYEAWDGKGSLVALILGLNLHRRHLTPGQKAFVALGLEPHLAQEAKQRQAHGQTAPGRTLTEEIPEAFKGEAREQAAKLVGVNAHYVTDAKRIADKAPDLAAKIRAGASTITQAHRELEEAGREQRREANRRLIARVPTPTAALKQAKFATIMIDPPWDWVGKGDLYGRGEPDYATMSQAQLLELPVAELADIDCHIFLWVTNHSLPRGFELIEKWGFRYVTCLTWCKPWFGMSNYFRGSTEHILFGIKGSQPLKRRDVGTWFDAPRGPGGHSSKPVEAYQLIESCSPGPYLEMFARAARPGWIAWGQDSAIKAA
jgi:N6-adenosine-specific RNA methylase IME4